MLSNYPQLRYCKIQKGKKAPFEKDWTNKPYTWEEIQKHIKSEINYGVLCGYGDLAVIDCDNPELQKHVEAVLPATFRIKTGRGGMHNYFFVPNLQNKIILTTKLQDKEVHWGEVQSKGTQVVGDGSIHPNGNKYEVVAPMMIATISEEQLMAAVRPFMHESQQSDENADWEKQKYGKSGIDMINVKEVWGTLGLKAHGDEYYGAHPIHGSESGMNFWLNPSKNLWHCFRCSAGGGALSAIAVKEGIINCSEAQKGTLRGAIAVQALKAAKERYGLREIQQYQEIEEKTEKEEKLMLWEYELDNYKEEDKEWIIEKLIPNCSVGVWTGKRGTFKTFLVLSAIFAISSGKPFLNKFPTRQGKVIYLDKENGVYVMRERKNLIKKGLEIEDEKLPVGFICFSPLKIDKQRDINAIEELIVAHKPSLLVIDTYRRGISFEENDAGKVSWLFVDILRPLVEKHKITILLIHHDRKGEAQGDEMDMIRGSSDLANYADFIMKNERRGEMLILKQLKMRSAPEIKPFEISITNKEDVSIRFQAEGEFEIKTKDQRCAEILTMWIIKEEIKQFKTEEAREIAFKEGIRKQNFFRGLQLMVDKGFLQRGGRGEYLIISKEGKIW